MDKQDLEAHITRLQTETPQIINALYEALDGDDMDHVREVLCEQTGFDMDGMASRGDALMAIIVLKGLSGIQLTEEEKKSMDTAMAFRQAQIKAGTWHPEIRWNGTGFSRDESEEYLY